MNEEYNSEELRTTQPLVRTVNSLKNTTTNIRGFADSVDHLLNAFEEFFPFIEKVANTTESVSKTLKQGSNQRYNRRNYRS